MRRLIRQCGVSSANTFRSTPPRIAAALLAVGMAAGLAGCGGGDGAGPNPSAPAATSADAGPTISLFDAVAYTSRHGDNRAFAISGSRTDPNPPAAGGASAAPVTLTGNGMLSISPAAAAQFDGAPVLKSTQVISGSLVADGQATPLDVTTVRYVDPSSLALVARADNGVVTRLSSNPLPTAVHVGSSGVLATGGAGSSDALPLGVTTTSYAIGRDSTTSVLLTVVDTVAVAGVPVTDVRTVTRIHLDGSAELVSITTERFNLGRLFETVTLSFA